MINYKNGENWEIYIFLFVLRKKAFTMKIECQRWQYIYCINVTVFCTLLFMIGFFPVKKRSGSLATDQDIPSSLKDIRMRREILYTPSVSKTVIMVIDALRYDFVEGVMGSTNMPFISQLLNEDKACLLKARANPPTVTMPRIKALTTGTVPNFIDVVLNLGSSRIQEDNIIYQVSRLKKIVFYGDDTWLKLYPDVFTRSEGTTSFYVTDYTEVDNNVTRNVKQELSNEDWDIMILHYLGLDHIGHLEGPRSSLVPPKLKEMDNIVQMIYNNLLEYDKKGNNSSLLVVCGDHGMKDTGSHGGASLAEVLTPVVTLGLNCPGYNKEELLQINVAPTLSVLWGLPLPADNVGHIIVPLLHKFKSVQKLYALYYNAQQLSNTFLRNGGNPEHEGYNTYNKSMEMHYKWLLNPSDSMTVQEIVSGYERSLRSMSSYLSEAMIRYDIPVLIVSIFIQFQVFFIMMLNVSGTVINTRTIVTAILLSILLVFLQSIYCHITCTESLLCSYFLITTSCSFLTSINITLLVVNRYIFRHLQFTKHFSSEVLFLWFGQVLFLLSLTSSSLIEEEHQIWYFLWITVCFLFSVRTKHFVQWFLLACTHRVLCKLNQTGDKWAHLPDIGDWLSHTDYSFLVFLIVTSGLVFIYCCSWFKSSTKNPKWLTVIVNVLTTALVASVYLYKIATTNITFIFSYPKSRGVNEIKVFWSLFWILLGIKLLYIGCSIQKKFHVSAMELRQSLCDIFIQSWMFICCLLMRPHNMLLLPALYTFSHVISQHSKTNKSFTVQSTLLHHWLGMVFFFYQGNSNSLSSIDVAAGYAGLSHYNVYQVGLLLFIHTYAAPVLAFLLNLRAIVSSNIDWREEVTRCLGTLVLQQMCHTAVYHCFVTSQRYHLFVWTVFSPKLLYLASQTLLYTFLINCTQLMVLCTDKIKRKL